MNTPRNTRAALSALLASTALCWGTAGAADLSHADSAFLKDAAHAGHAEVEGSQLALKKTTEADVKTFAQQMIDDHTKAGQELAALASSKGVKVSSEPSLAQKAKIKLLQASNGPTFDSNYADGIGVSAHEDAVKLFRKASTEAKDADVKAFAAKTLPALEHHLQMAKDLAAAAKAREKK